MGKRKEAARNANWPELLTQDRWWRQADGSMIRVDAMELSHIYSVLAILERQAPRLGRSMAYRATAALMTFPDDPSDGVFAAMSEIEAEAEEWSRFPNIRMRRMPLYQALFFEAVNRVDGKMAG